MQILTQGPGYVDAETDPCLLQATDAIVDNALQAGKPFAVVPCCVFPRLFSSRRLRNGQPVRSYAQVYICCMTTRVDTFHPAYEA